MTPPTEPSSPLDGGIRKRVCKACDRCRLKKSKCDGASPCSRCKADNAICVFGERKKSHDKVYPKGYVEMLESQQAQLVTGLQELYRRLQKGQGWIGSALKESGSGQPLTHDILERLGALKQDGHTTNDTFEEDLDLLQQRLIADGAGYMQRAPSHDSHSLSDSSAPSPIYEPVAQRPNFSNPFPISQYPPTPPNHSPFPPNARTVSLKSQNYPNVAINHSNLSWNTPMTDFDEAMDFSTQYDAPLKFEPSVMDSSMDLSSFPQAMFQDQIVPTAINPCLTIKDWSAQEDFHRYFNPSAMA
ncbi:hypothetical protein B0A52_00615 [Exophiala mesophila]|uniref:Zn(2)-C6 fungal-type domain-containing protein n=1 Tax=Exophiala mesophila TaxID=212818 RepID=A0A438NHQ8_EXOME|nr:hypothetical protein B0A52_00615 [Exophiala mesophila]